MRSNYRALNACQLGRPDFEEVDLPDQTGFLREGMIL